MKRKKIGYKKLYSSIEKEWSIYKPFHEEVFKLTGGSQYVDPKSPLAFSTSEVFETRVNEHLYKIKRSRNVTPQGLRLLKDLQYLTQPIKNQKNQNKIASKIAKKVLHQYTAKWLKEYLKVAKGDLLGKEDTIFLDFLNQFGLEHNKDFWTAFRMSGYKYFQPMINWENYKRIDYDNAKVTHLKEYEGEKYGGQSWYSERVMAFYYEIWLNENYQEMMKDGINYKSMKKVRNIIKQETIKKRKKGN